LEENILLGESLFVNYLQALTANLV
jgi:hypothetical protein